MMGIVFSDTQSILKYVKDNIDEIDGHWIWTGWTNSHGYPTIRDESGMPTGLHRWMLQTLGAGVREGQEASHNCDGPKLCIHPLHIISETHSDNVRRQLRCKQCKWCELPYTHAKLKPDRITIRQQICGRCNPELINRPSVVMLDPAAARISQ